jgi:hypothetical protein
LLGGKISANEKRSAFGKKLKPQIHTDGRRQMDN